MAASVPRLYALPASAPCAAVQAALELKSIRFRRVELLPLTQVLIGPLLYGGRTVPGLRVDGERVVGSRAIMRRLDRLAPEPALLPAPGAPSYARVLEIERWGDEILQGAGRRLLNAAFLRCPGAMEGYAAAARMALPIALLRPALGPAARLMAFRYHARADEPGADLAALPRQLARIEEWIAQGLLGNPQPNAADLQLGSSIRVLSSIGDIRPLIDASAAAQLTGYFPEMVGEVPAGVLPASWLAAGEGP